MRFLFEGLGFSVPSEVPLRVRKICIFGSGFKVLGWADIQRGLRMAGKTWSLSQHAALKLGVRMTLHGFRIILGTSWVLV